VAPSTEEDFNTLRGVAADYLRAHAEDFCPFLGMELGDPEYDAYCAKVASLTEAEWGGQLEIKAISAALQRPILVYSANAPVLCMNDAEASLEDVPPLRITFHRHYFALGEHYNSVMPMS
jgi:OTU domain-containing protein 6